MNTIKRIFLVLFVLSTLSVLVLFVLSSLMSETPAPSMTHEPGTPSIPATVDPNAVDPSSQNSVNINYIALAGSAITSITSLIGFITTTAITWRKEKREASLADVERKKLETELEKSKLELEELRKSREKKEAKRKK